jgi:hypothetical protein
MLFNILKLFGLDLPAKIAAARLELERRVEDAAAQVKQAAATAAELVILYVLAALAALLAIGVGLIALYRYITFTYGEFYGFASVGGLLVIVAAILLAAALSTGKSWARASADMSRMRRERALADAASARAERAAEAMAAAALVEQSRHEGEARAVEARRGEAKMAGAAPYQSGLASAPLKRIDSASDLIEPLTFLLSRVLKFPSIGNPFLDELVGHLRVAARETTDEAIEGTASTLRYGSRSTLVVVLGGATFLGWLLARHGRVAPGR